jgi:hypothetical protein
MKPHLFLSSSSLSGSYSGGPKASAGFVERMEDVLETYKQPCDPKRLLVCFDETFHQLIGESREPLPVLPGKPAVSDYEYVRNGVADFFMMVEPFAGRRYVKVTGSRTKKDFAHCLYDLVETHYPEAEKIILLMDNLNTHSLTS